MAGALIEMMAELGYDRFATVGHDRGGRVAYGSSLNPIWWRDDLLKLSSHHGAKLIRRGSNDAFARSADAVAQGVRQRLLPQYDRLTPSLFAGQHGRGRDETHVPPTGSPEAVARLRLPQNVACGFTAPRSSAVDSQHCFRCYLFKFRCHGQLIFSLNRRP